MVGCRSSPDLTPVRVDADRDGRIDEADVEVFAYRLAASITHVDAMYRYGDLRPAASNPAFTLLPAGSTDWDEGRKDLDVFFTHGFNVNESDARKWGRILFKRFWHAGFNARFHMLTWEGNYYSSGDDVFKEFATVPSRLDGLETSVEMFCWQKQETLKGGNCIAGTAYGGWGFHLTLGDVFYSSLTAADAVADGSVTNNPVFNHGFSPMFDRNASLDDQWLALAKYVPAVSSPMGGNAVVFGNKIENHDLNAGNDYRNGWGRRSSDWQHSDMKDMAYFYVSP